MAALCQLTPGKHQAGGLGLAALNVFCPSVNKTASHTQDRAALKMPAAPDRRMCAPPGYLASAVHIDGKTDGRNTGRSRYRQSDSTRHIDASRARKSGHLCTCSDLAQNIAYLPSLRQRHAPSQVASRPSTATAAYFFGLHLVLEPNQNELKQEAHHDQPTTTRRTATPDLANRQ